MISGGLALAADHARATRCMVFDDVLSAAVGLKSGGSAQSPGVRYSVMRL